MCIRDSSYIKIVVNIKNLPFLDYTEIYKLFINYCEKIQRQNKFNPERHFEMDVEKFSFDF